MTAVSSASGFVDRPSYLESNAVRAAKSLGEGEDLTVQLVYCEGYTTGDSSLSCTCLGVRRVISP